MTSEKVQTALKRALELKGALEATRGERDRQKGELAAISEDQTRVRANLEKVPVNSPLQKRYQDKLDSQETDIEKLQGQLKKLAETEQRQENEYRSYLSSLTVE